MTRLKTIQVGARSVEIHSFSGEVMASEKWSTIEVSGDDGRGVVNQGSGCIEHKPITSKTTTHDQLFVRAANGDEESPTLENVSPAG